MTSKVEALCEIHHAVPIPRILAKLLELELVSKGPVLPNFGAFSRCRPLPKLADEIVSYF